MEARGGEMRGEPKDDGKGSRKPAKVPQGAPARQNTGHMGPPPNIKLPLKVQIEPDWEEVRELAYTTSKHQTLFAMDPTTGKFIVGAPPNPAEIKRLCASITSYMKPRFRLQVFDADGEPVKHSFSTRLTVVNANTGQTDQGSCDHCKDLPADHRPIMHQWLGGKSRVWGELLSRTNEQGQQMYDLKIGCLTGTGLSRQQKGHKYDFRLRVELPDFPGAVGYSAAMQMGSKYIDCSQRHSKKKASGAKKAPAVQAVAPAEPARSRTPSPAPRSLSPMQITANLVPAVAMQVSPPSTAPSPLPDFREPLHRHSIVLPPISAVSEMAKKPFFREENRHSAPALAFPGREVPAWQREQTKSDPRAAAPAVLPPIRSLSHLDHAPDSLHRPALPPLRQARQDPVIPPLEVILSSISQEHGDARHDSHHRKSPMLEVAESFVEAASTMEQTLVERDDGFSERPSTPVEQRLKERRIRRKMEVSSDHNLWHDQPRPNDSKPLSPMSECAPSVPAFESRAAPSVESMLGCPANALTLEQRAEIWQFLCGNRTNASGNGPLRHIVLNHEPVLWSAHHFGNVVEQTILELNYETGRWATYKKYGHCRA